MSFAVGGILGGGLVNMSAGIAHSRIPNRQPEDIRMEFAELEKEEREILGKIARGKNAKDSQPCCCGNINQCIFNYNIFIFKSSKKEAYETARHWPGARGVVLHYHNNYPNDNFPHYHPTFDFEGEDKIPGIHIRFPK